jgi:phosphogluconate dehydratase
MIEKPAIAPTIAVVTQRIQDRSRETRSQYLGRLRAARLAGPGRAKLSCANYAHAFAGQTPADKLRARDPTAPNIGIVTAYNDMLSAHQPFETYPRQIRGAAREVGATAQVAGGVPAMCDGVTQGRSGMELSLFSRDVIAMATAIALSHDAFDAVLALGVCDKIVPGLLIGALAFGHLPVLLIPAGPMESGLPNAEKSRVRNAYAAGEVGREELLAAETESYHGPGTCTFYGTANTNQMLMETMGLHLPGSAFVHPGSDLRMGLTRAAVHRAVALARTHEAPLGLVLDERAIVNGIVGLMATGGSTNHAIHLVAIARAAGILVDWTDFDEISAATPLLARIYPNGPADVNAFQAAGGTGFVIRELLNHGLLHEDVTTVSGGTLRDYTAEPAMVGREIAWQAVPEKSLDDTILRSAGDPFSRDGGLRLVSGALGRAIIKVSAVKAEHRRVEAPAAVFDSQEDVLDAFKTGRLDRDVIVFVRFQGPQANGMPELHNLMAPLCVLQDRGYRVALVTDGRLSGASGRIPAALHLNPEAQTGGPLARLMDGDLVLLDADAGILEVKVESDRFSGRACARRAPAAQGCGRELFGHFRTHTGDAESGASVLFA